MLIVKKRLLGVIASLLLAGAQGASAQANYSYYGVLDVSYGRFEPSGFYRVHRFNSNSMTASFAGVNANYAFENGLTPGITLETFFRVEDFQTGRRDSDPHLSRRAFVSLGSKYGTLNAGRLQTLLFDTTTRFNALGNSVAFSPAVRHVFASGNLEGVQGDFFWNRAVSYVSPTWEGVTASVMYGEGPSEQRGDLSAASIVVSRGLFAAAVSAQRVHIDDGINDPTDESAWQLGSTYNFGFARVFGQYTQTNDRGLDVRSKIASAGVAVPIGPGTVQLQAASTTADGPAVDRKHTTLSAAYLYAYDSVTDFYIVGMDDRVRGQTIGISFAAGVRWRF